MVVVFLPSGDVVFVVSTFFFSQPRVIGASKLKHAQSTKNRLMVGILPRYSPGTRQAICRLFPLPMKMPASGHLFPKSQKRLEKESGLLSAV